MPEEELVELKFRIYDGSDIGPFRYSPASTVAMVKERIVSEWPKGQGLQLCVLQFYFEQLLFDVSVFNCTCFLFLISYLCFLVHNLADRSLGKLLKVLTLVCGVYVCVN